MRARLVVLIILGLVAACSNQSQQVSATPPTVSYQVHGNDLSQANASASRYCEQYRMMPQLQTVQPSGSQSVAHYTCVGGLASTSAGIAPTVGYGTVTPMVQCADALHQGRPGGTDYEGPPIPGCPPSR